jgi:hypothetical protein
MFRCKYLFGAVAGWVPGRWRDVKIKQEWLLQGICRPDQQKLHRSGAIGSATGFLSPGGTMKWLMKPDQPVLWDYLWVMLRLD